MTGIYLGLLLFVGLVAAAVAAFWSDVLQRRRMITGATVGTERAGVSGTPWGRLSGWFTRTRPGRYLQTELTLSGLSYPPLSVAIVLLVLTIVLPYVLSALFAPLFGALGLILGFVILRVWLRRQRARRQERFVQQIPELARVLSNAANAGLSIITAWSIAEREMYEPARTEIQKVNEAVRFGAPLETALGHLYERVPAREVRVLVSTLAVSIRSGGSLVKALRDISVTLDDRKEVRREVRTTLAQARVTSWLVAAMAVGMLVMLNVIQPGTVEKMTQNIIGQVTLVVGFSLLALGQFLAYRVTKVDV